MCAMFVILGAGDCRLNKEEQGTHKPQTPIFGCVDFLCIFLDPIAAKFILFWCFFGKEGGGGGEARVNTQGQQLYIQTKRRSWTVLQVWVAAVDGVAVYDVLSGVEFQIGQDHSHQRR